MWRRRQFPVRVAFAMTVNKSQGQTFTGRVGLFLPEPVFDHGQFYVACSRTVSPDNMRVCVLHDPPVVVADHTTHVNNGGGEDEEDMMHEMEREMEEHNLAGDEDEEDIMHEMEREGDDDEEDMMYEMEQLALAVAGDDDDWEMLNMMNEQAAMADDELMRMLEPHSPEIEGGDEDEEEEMRNMERRERDVPLLTRNVVYREALT